VGVVVAEHGVAGGVVSDVNALAPTEATQAAEGGEPDVGEV
jgi:hypothetical protein